MLYLVKEIRWFLSRVLFRITHTKISYGRGLKMAFRVSKSRKARVTLGNNVFVDTGTHFGCSLKVGDDVMIARNCAFVGGDHVIPEDTSLKLNSTGRDRVSPIVIEDNVWLGHGVIILAGVKIGTGSIIGAGSVVTKDVDSNVVMAGCPAKVLKKR